MGAFGSPLVLPVAVIPEVGGSAAWGWALARKSAPTITATTPTTTTAARITQEGNPLCFFFSGIARRGDICYPLLGDLRPIIPKSGEMSNDMVERFYWG